jgi:hypothetical protein
VIGEPPVIREAVKEMLAPLSAGVAEPIVGAAGAIGKAGVALEALELALLPVALVAAIEQL